MKIQMLTVLSINECADRLESATFHKKRDKTSNNIKRVWGSVSKKRFKLTVRRPWFLELIPVRIFIKGRWVQKDRHTEIVIRSGLGLIVTLIAGAINLALITLFLIALFYILYSSVTGSGPGVLAQIALYAGLFYVFLILYGFNQYFKKRKNEDRRILEAFIRSTLKIEPE